MEKRLEEKKRTIEVLENVLSGMEWTEKTWKSQIDDYNKAVEEDPENVRDWEKQQADQAAAYLNIWEAVKKHLEKLL
jgi:hypothetical protein